MPVSFLGFPLADPIIGLLIGVAILLITWDAAKRIWYRLMDAVEPELVDRVEAAVVSYPQVQSIERLRLHWVGHHRSQSARQDRPGFLFHLPLSGYGRLLLQGRHFDAGAYTRV